MHKCPKEFSSQSVFHHNNWKCSWNPYLLLDKHPWKLYPDKDLAKVQNIKLQVLTGLQYEGGFIIFDIQINAQSFKWIQITFVLELLRKYSCWYETGLVPHCPQKWKILSSELFLFPFFACKIGVVFLLLYRS